MKIAFTPDGWSDFTEWIATDRKKLNRIDQEHRLVYRVATQNGEQVLEIAKCRRHY
jgi:Txe/YoeB family toxin of Txe-Axe toxin-antitoxin module